MTILHRNSGSFSATTSFNVARSSGSFGTGTTVVLEVFSNTIVNTLSGFTQRASSVVDLGLYAFDKTAAGESSFTFTCSAGSGLWYVWELSAGSAFLSPSSATQNSSGAVSFTSGTLTPSAGARHLLVASGGVGSGNVRSVTGFNNSFTPFGAAQVAAQDWPFASGADLDVAADGLTGYNTTASFSGTAQTASGAIFLAYADGGSGPSAPVAQQRVMSQAVNRSFTY